MSAGATLLLKCLRLEMECLHVAASGPSITDYKKLFARSGNRCAFPKCPASIIHEDTLLGEVAHRRNVQTPSAVGAIYL